MKKYKFVLLAVLLGLFGFATLFLSTSVLFDLFGFREKEGNFLWFVVGTNFACSLLYIPAAYGFYKQKRWTVPLLVSAALLLLVALVMLVVYINSGGIYENKTIGALVFRLALTIALAFFAGRISRKSPRIRYLAERS